MSLKNFMVYKSFHHKPVCILQLELFIYILYIKVTVSNVCCQYRNELRAAAHYRRHLMVQTLAAWRRYVIVTQRERDTEQARQTTHIKMAAFLDAAASGKLWTDRTSKTPSDETEMSRDSDRMDAGTQQVT